MSFFDDAGAWFDQAGKDTGEWFDQAVQDTGDMLTGISKAPNNDPVSELPENDPVLKEQFSDRQTRYIMNETNRMHGGTYDPITNPNPGLDSSAFKFSELGFDARFGERLSVLASIGDCRTIEAFQIMIARGDSDLLSRNPEVIEAFLEGLVQESCPAF
ncbi:hypothetical protein OAE71_02785 [Synechococcus sp. AH-551-A21]|nr:hypothetical protein [Synechococcus sp. AH-551-A21]MDB4678066.1 hypothetical protein [Synechococcus sp. AH-551-A21]